MHAVRFIGESCANHGELCYFKSFGYVKHGIYRSHGVGDFFFVRTSPEEELCIGELQLLWEDKTKLQKFAKIGLYYLPEQTPAGRQPHHGEHEVLKSSDMTTISAETLMDWITNDVEWEHGLIAMSRSNSLMEEEESPSEPEEPEEEIITGDIVHDGEHLITTEVRVLSYSDYCRYRGMLCRLEGNRSAAWLTNEVALALGLLSVNGQKVHIVFCRDNFQQNPASTSATDSNENPSSVPTDTSVSSSKTTVQLKYKPHKKRMKLKRRTSPDPEESNTSEDSKDNKDSYLSLKARNGYRNSVHNDEQLFLQELFKFMKDRNTPIHRVPHLGFKQIDLFRFYNRAQRYGGYYQITNKRLWKNIYDSMGGDPGSTSAATCTRKHYEKLLLPYERYLRGEIGRSPVSSPNSKDKPGEEKAAESTSTIQIEEIIQLPSENNGEDIPEGEEETICPDVYIEEPPEEVENPSKEDTVFSFQEVDVEPKILEPKVELKVETVEEHPLKLKLEKMPVQEHGKVKKLWQRKMMKTNNEVPEVKAVKPNKEEKWNERKKNVSKSWKHGKHDIGQLEPEQTPPTLKISKISSDATVTNGITLFSIENANKEQNTMETGIKHNTQESESRPKLKEIGENKQNFHIGEKKHGRKKHNFRESEIKHNVRETKHRIRESETNHSVGESESKHNDRENEAKHDGRVNEVKNVVRESELKTDLWDVEANHKANESVNKHNVRENETKRKVRESETNHNVQENEAKHNVRENETQLNIREKDIKHNVRESEIKHDTREIEAKHYIRENEVKHNVKENGKKSDVREREAKYNMQEVDGKHLVHEIETKHNVREMEAKHNVREMEAKHNVREMEAKHNVREIEAKHNIRKMEAKHSVRDIEVKHCVREIEAKTVRAFETKYNVREIEPKHNALEVENKQNVRVSDIKQNVLVAETKQNVQASEIKHVLEAEVKQNVRVSETKHHVLEAETKHNVWKNENKHPNIRESESNHYPVLEAEVKHHVRESETRHSAREDETKFDALGREAKYNDRENEIQHNIRDTDTKYSDRESEIKHNHRENDNSLQMSQRISPETDFSKMMAGSFAFQAEELRSQAFNGFSSTELQSRKSTVPMEYNAVPPISIANSYTPPNITENGRYTSFPIPKNMREINEKQFSYMNYTDNLKQENNALPKMPNLNAVEQHSHGKLPSENTAIAHNINQFYVSGERTEVKYKEKKMKAHACNKYRNESQKHQSFHSSHSATPEKESNSLRRPSVILHTEQIRTPPPPLLTEVSSLSKGLQQNLALTLTSYQNLGVPASCENQFFNPLTIQASEFEKTMTRQVYDPATKTLHEVVIGTPSKSRQGSQPSKRRGNKSSDHLSGKKEHSNKSYDAYGQTNNYNSHKSTSQGGKQGRPKKQSIAHFNAANIEKMTNNSHLASREMMHAGHQNSMMDPSLDPKRPNHSMPLVLSSPYISSLSKSVHLSYKTAPYVHRSRLKNSKRPWETEVLDLSLKRTKRLKIAPQMPPIVPQTVAECLDLTMKKKVQSPDTCGVPCSLDILTPPVAIPPARRNVPTKESLAGLAPAIRKKRYVDMIMPERTMTATPYKEPQLTTSGIETPTPSLTILPRGHSSPYSLPSPGNTTGLMTHPKQYIEPEYHGKPVPTMPQLLPTLFPSAEVIEEMAASTMYREAEPYHSQSVPPQLYPYRYNDAQFYVPRSK